ncbi:hypothetical protein M405DRAFT_827989, partial [Rhizopogon salebrosus TDB-379]
MPTIEKIQETWTSGSITTLFRLCSKADIDTSPPLYSPIAGYKWSLLLSRAPSKSLDNKQPRGGKKITPSQRPCGPLKCKLFFYCNTCHSAWHGAQVEVTLSVPSHPGGELANPPTSTTLVLKRGDSHLLNSYSTDDLGDALVSLEVTFTSLPTCNLFQVLAQRGPIPRAHTGAGESCVPEALALRALQQSLKTGTSPDTIFQVYSCRLSPGIVTKPIPIYANATVLQATTLLPDFAEEYLDASSLFELPEGGTPPFTSLESYEYASDSDLDDEEGDKLAAVQPAEELAGGGEASTCHEEQSHTAQTQGDTTDGGSISSFSSFEVGSQEQPSNRMSLLEEAETMTSGSRVILVKGVAWKTWHAFVYYCYTGIVNFSSLRSQVGTDATLQQSPFKDDTPCCSPKSMYQLARKVTSTLRWCISKS